MIINKNKGFIENHILYFSSSAVVAFLRSYNTDYKTKDYEFFSSLLINRFCEKQWEKDCMIGFPIKLDFVRAFYTKKSASLEQINMIFRKGINQDSLIDFIIQPTSGQEVSFQIKRFGIGKTKKDTQELIDFLNSDKITRLQKQESICLIVALDPGVSLNGKELKEKMNFEKFPFAGLILFGSRKIDQKVFYLQLFPNSKEGIAINDGKLIQCNITELSLITC